MTKSANGCSKGTGEGAPNGNCGYANGTQTQDGTIIVAYYIMHYAGDNYRRLWGDSKVYIARFTEEQFLAAAE